jgi:hypothetical protein
MHLRLVSQCGLSVSCVLFGACASTTGNDAGDSRASETSTTGGTTASTTASTTSVSSVATATTATTNGASSASSSASKSSGDASVAIDGSAAADGGDGGACASPTTYDDLVLCDAPVAYWAVDQAPASEPDLTGHGNGGTYRGGTPSLVTLPNGDRAADFNGSSEYLTVSSSAAFSIPTTGNLSFEGWIRPDVLQFPHDDGVSGYVDWMGKCDSYAPSCEWEARMYDATTQESPNRPDRLSAYVFNPSAGLGSAADWQPSAGVIVAGRWLHVVGEYTTLAQPADCPNAPQAPGSIDIWIDGVRWSQSNHNPTGCMSQYSVVPTAGPSALNIATMATDSWFAGAIGKVAIYDYLLSPAQIAGHYRAMTGSQPTGSCADTCTF